MSMKTITLVAVSDTARQRQAPIVTLLERARFAVREAFRRGLERARERRQARLTASALEHLGPRELRDIGLVRRHDIHPTRYLRTYDLW